MKKAKTKCVALILASIMLMAGCSKLKGNNVSADVIVSTEETEISASEKKTEEFSETSEGEKTDPEDDSYKFEYKQYVASDMFKETMGKDVSDAYRNFIEAIENGETEFECADEDSFDWMMGQYAYNCNPCVAEYVVSGSYSDGKGTFSYTIPEDEFRQKLEEFEQLVTDIINGAGIKEDDSDLEKALLIYLYMIENYEYDYVAAESYTVDQLSAYRLFTTGHGICQEIGIGYAYLLMELGIDAAGSGGIGEDGIGHEWAIVHINDQYYNVDPTFGLGTKTLAYFMMTDDTREFYGGYKVEDVTKVNHYPLYHDDDYVCPYICDDDTFPDFGFVEFYDLDHENNIIYYTSCETAEEINSFDFSSYT